MVRRVFTALLATAMMTTTAYAGGWQADTSGGWKYQNTDGSYLREGWYWVDGRCYSFDTQGYIRSGCVTGDGFTVDDSGAWVSDGVVQTRATSESVGVLQVSIPNGYESWLNNWGGRSVELCSENGAKVYVEAVEDLDRDTHIPQYDSDTYAEMLVNDFVVFCCRLEPEEQDLKTYQSGVWHHVGGQEFDEDGALRRYDFYLRSEGDYVYQVVIFGDHPEFTADQFMTHYIWRQ